jgi:hypothetical protein
MASTGSNSSAPAADAATTRADILVALTSHNDARTVGGVVRAVAGGLSQYFGDLSAQVVLADGGSTDATREAAREALGGAGLVELEYPLQPALADVPYHGHPHRARAVRAAFQEAARLEARACVLLDASLNAVEPAWVGRLIGPVLAGRAEFVGAHFVRHVHEGALTKGIVYPVFRALYGVRLRQPASSEFGCSARVAASCLEQDFWETELAPSGIDLWVTTTAVSSGYGVCEAALGPRQAAAREAATDLSTTLAQVVGALFTDLDHRVDIWQRVRGSTPVPLVGEDPDAGSDVRPMAIEGLIESFRLGYRELREIWTWVLPPRAIVELRRLAAAPPEQFRFDDRLWASVIYDFAFGFSQRVMPRSQLLRSLTPLYSGWLASFVQELRHATQAEIEARVERLCQGFEAEKRHLISRWRWPEKLR